MKSPIRIYLTNLAAYNRGDLVGQWYNLPMSEEDLKDAEEEVLHGLPGTLPGDEELFITDYESDFVKVNEYDSLQELNELAERIEDAIDEYNEDLVEVVMDQFANPEEALDVLERGDFRCAYDVYDHKDLGHFLVDERLFGGVEIPEEVYIYLDFEAIGRDLCCDGWIIDHAKGIAVYI